MNDGGRPPKEPATATNIATATAPATGAGARLDSTGVTIDFGELLLGTLELAEHENTAIGYADTAAASPPFVTGVRTPAAAVTVAAELPDTADVYFSVNAVRPRQPGDTRRGSEADVTRLTALYADLDVKPGGCPTLDVARAIAAEVGIILGSAPAAFVESGHGLHPYWVIEDGHVTDGDITAARSLVHRFGRLVAAVAKNHRVAVDGVYDLARMLRVPGTLNNKVSADGRAVPVVAYRGTGRPLSMAEVAERLDEVGIEETDEDRVPGTEIVSPPTDWRWAETTCGYVAAMIGGWATDTPTARNPWHYANRIRLECARRNGCITEVDYRRAEQILADRLTELVATTEPRRALKRLEIAGAAARAVGVAAAKSDDDVARELGRHNHAGTAGDFWGTGASPAIGRLEQVADEPPADDGLAGSDAATGRGQSIEPVSLADARDVFRRWLGDDYDIDALHAVLVTAAVESLDGDPLWLLLISGSGNAKTETVQCLDGIGAVVTATITEGGLLSATPRKERAKDATGGLLRKLEPRGVLVIKDVTSILSMNTETRAQVLGALREVYDGRWSRNVGTDGGRTLEWTGRIAVVGAVTTAWDKAHSVIASMGDRFVLIRMDSTTGRTAAGRKAIGNTGSEVEMRTELAAAAAGVLAGMNPNPVTLTDAETEVLLAAADLVTLARTGVEYDYRGDVTDAHAPEMPTRFAKQLAQIVRGGVAIGMDRLAAMRLAIRAARDSVPPMRLAIIDDVAKYPNSSTADVRRRIDKPRATVDRQLQALHMLGVLECDEADGMHRGKPVTLWYYRLAENIEPGALDPTALADPDSVPDLPPPTPNPNKERAGGVSTVPSTLQPLSGKSGTALGAAAPTPCVYCGEPTTAGQRDDAGQPAHLSCQQIASARVGAS